MQACPRQCKFSRSWGFPGTRLDKIFRHFFTSSFFCFLVFSCLFLFLAVFFKVLKLLLTLFSRFPSGGSPKRNKPARPGQARPGQARPGQARPGQARQGKARQGKASASFKKVRELLFISFSSGLKHFLLHLVPAAGAPKGTSKQRTKDKGQRTKDKGQRTKDKGQRTKDKGQRTKDKGQKGQARKNDINLCRSRTPAYTHKARNRRKSRH